MSEVGSGFVELIQDTTESVYVGSGAINTPPIPTATPSPTATPAPSPTETPAPKCWVNWQCTWTGHNNGGHSVCHVSANHCGDHSGECLEMNFRTNFEIKEVKNASGYIISGQGPYSFTITRINHFNANDNIGFNFEIVTTEVYKDSAGNDTHGAIGDKEAPNKKVEVYSYRCS